MSEHITHQETSIDTAPSTQPEHTDGQVDIESRADAVTFFEDRAQVTRRATVHLVAGEQSVHVSGLSLLVNDPSLVVRILSHEGEQEPRVLSNKIHRIMRVKPTTPTSDLDELEETYKQAQETLEQLTQKLNRINSRITRTEGLSDTMRARIYHVPHGEGATEESWRQAWRQLDEQSAALHDQRSTCIAEQQHQRRISARAQLRLDQGRVLKREIDALAHVQIRSAEAQSVELEIQYFVPCALWRPSHMAQLKRDDPEHHTHINITTFATVWQTTGEAWDDVECTFSTARPTQAASPPVLVDDVLRTRQKTEREKRIIDVEARDQTISLTKNDGVRAVDAMPGVDDGGEPVLLSAMERVSIPSTGEAFKVQLMQLRLPAQVETVVYPELQAAAHIKATATWSAATPLLAGPVMMLRASEIIGTSKIEFVSSGESFEMGFGLEHGIRIQRELTSKQSGKKLSRKKLLSRKIRLHISNTSDKAHDITIIERIPVSEIEAIKVDIQDDGGGDIDEHGFLKRSVHIKPNQRQKLNIKYQLEMAHNVNLSL